MHRYCPHCGGKPTNRFRLDFLVCSVCAELLYINELVK